MSPLLRRENAIIELQPAADYYTTSKVGLLVTFSSEVATVSNSATVKATGVILEGPATTGTTTEHMTVGILGAMAGTCSMKAGGNITKGAFVQQSTDGSVVTDAGTGSRVLVGVALESAVSGDLFEVAPLASIVLS